MTVGAAFTPGDAGSDALGSVTCEPMCAWVEVGRVAARFADGGALVAPGRHAHQRSSARAEMTDGIACGPPRSGQDTSVRDGTDSSFATVEAGLTAFRAVVERSHHTLGAPTETMLVACARSVLANRVVVASFAKLVCAAKSLERAIEAHVTSRADWLLATGERLKLFENPKRAVTVERELTFLQPSQGPSDSALDARGVTDLGQRADRRTQVRSASGVCDARAPSDLASDLFDRLRFPTRLDDLRRLAHFGHGDGTWCACRATRQQRHAQMRYLVSAHIASAPCFSSSAHHSSPFMQATLPRTRVSVVA